MIATHCSPADRLQDLAHGRLSDERSDQLFDHVRGCEACRSELDSIQDGDDSLIASLRAPDELAGFEDEPGCRLAVAKALGVLATAEKATAGDLSDFLPRTIGEYEVLRPLGRGGMGSVFLARHTKLGRHVALKVLAGHRLADPRMKERFDAEMRAVGKLSHPNVVTAHDAREVDGTGVLVTEYIDGFDLGELVARTGPLRVADTCEIGRHVAMALAYTSGQGFVHRDVKPSNIMLSSEGQVKLLDLGLARLQFNEAETAGATAAGTANGGMTGTGQTMGTADYIAPEQVTDSRSVDVRADLYSLGCTLFKLLTGRAPFAGLGYPSVFAKMTAHVSERPPSLSERLPDAPTRLVKLVDSLLAKDPSKRPQSPGAVAKTLAEFTAGSDLQRLITDAQTQDRREGESVTEIREAETGRGQSQRRRQVPLSIAVVAGLLGLLVGFLCGITITIRKPDGSQISMTVPDGSNIDIRSTEADGERVGQAEPLGEAEAEISKRLVEYQQRLQGVWRLVSQRGMGMLQDTGEVLFILEGTSPVFRDRTLTGSGGLSIPMTVGILAGKEGTPTGSAVLILSHDERESISQVRLADVHGGMLWSGFANFVGENNVVLEFTTFRNRSSAESPYPAEPIPMGIVLERLGDIPRTEAEADALAEGQPPAFRHGFKAYVRTRATDDRSRNPQVPFGPPGNGGDVHVGPPTGVSIEEAEGSPDDGTPEKAELLQQIQDYWGVHHRRREGQPEATGIELVVVEGDQMHLLDDGQLVASGPLTLTSSLPGNFARFQFLDRLHGQQISGALRPSERSLTLELENVVRSEDGCDPILSA